MNTGEIISLTMVGCLLVVPILLGAAYGACELVLYMRRELRKR